jgi:membrane protease YdiL (CAAX protease family)
MENNNFGGEELPLNNFNGRTAGLTYSINVLIYLLGSLVMGILIGAFNIVSGSDTYIYLSYLVSPIAIAITLAIIFSYSKVKPAQVFPVKCKPKYYIIAVMLAFGLLFSLSWVNEFSLQFFKLFGYQERESTNYLPNLTGWHIVPAVIVIAVLPAIFEEALFRGVILRCGEQSVGSVRMIFIVGLCFSLFHASPEQTVYQFICGCVFAYLAVRSGSILPTVVMHFLNNAAIIFMYAFGGINENGDIAVSTATSIIVMSLSALCLICGLVWLFLDKKNYTPCQKGGVKTFFIFASFGVIALSIVWIAALFGVS